MPPSAQQQRGEQSDAEYLESRSGRLHDDVRVLVRNGARVIVHRRRGDEAGPVTELVVERHGEQRDAGIGLRNEPQQHQRQTDVAERARQEQPRPRAVDRVARRLVVGEYCRERAAAQCSDDIGGEVERTRDTRRDVHLQRFHRKRHRGADDNTVHDPSRRRDTAAQQRDEEAERDVGEDVQQRVVADPARRPEIEQEERCLRRQPGMKRLERRIDDRDAIQRREHVRQPRAQARR